MREISHEPIAGTGVEQHEGGALIPAHVHDDDQIVYVNSGVLAVTTRLGAWAVTPERAVLIPAGAWHEHRVFGRSSVHTLGLGSGTPASAHGGTPVILHMPALHRELLLALTRKELHPDASVIAKSLLVILAAGSSTKGLHLPKPTDARLARACSIVEANLSESPSLSELAARCGASERTLSRLFHTQFCLTYPQWRSVCRVFHASIALTEGRTITETAIAYGWATPSAFSTTFARLTGHTPTAYQRSL
ncbi:MAG TPA: AraC family transcriptional regulator [Gemmatimonadaceae bacterium]|nr:AraC family transcriptional regulator [Gemmatimonadaceae bacterium]